MTTPEGLRTLVAEKVMGYRKEECVLWGDEPETVFFMPETYQESEDGIGAEALVALEDWDPFESWADAGRVIERMSDLGFDMTLCYGPHGDDVWFCCTEYNRQGYSKGKSIRRDISLAALRALGVEVE